MTIVRCIECGKEYDLKRGDMPSQYKCECGGKLKVKIIPKNIPSNTQNIVSQNQSTQQFYSIMKCIRCGKEYRVKKIQIGMHCECGGLMLLHNPSSFVRNPVGRETSRQDINYPKYSVLTKPYVKLENTNIHPDLKRWYESITVKIAQSADTKVIKSDENFEYLKTELGINILVPKGELSDLKFGIDFYGADNSDIIVQDGFPNDIITTQHLKGTIKLAINETFRIVPIAGDFLANIAQVELGPWEFNIANLRNNLVQFSGTKSNFVEWFFKDMEHMDDLRVILTLRKPLSTKNVKAKAKIACKYRTGRFNTPEILKDEREIQII